MPSTLANFQLGDTTNIQSDDFIVGYDTATLNGERRWTVGTIANAVSGAMSAELNNKFGGSGTVTNVTGTAPIAVANGTTTPAISIAAATTSAAGTMSSTDKTRLDDASTVNGILSCNGSGDFSAAVAGTDYLTSATLDASPTSAKAWVNFNGLLAVYTTGNTVTYVANSPSAGQTTVTVDRTATWSPLPVVGDWVTVSGVTGATAVNGTFQITEVDTVNFSIKYIVPSVVTGTVAGTAVVRITAIRGSYNVSSVTKSADGIYTVNFNTPMANANYAIIGTAGLDSNNFPFTINVDGEHTPTVNSFQVYSYTQSTGGTYVTASVNKNYIAVFST